MAQMLTGSIVRLAVTVATLAAIYFFVIRPVLDTTDKALNESSGVRHQISDAFDGAGISTVKIPRQGVKQAKKMLACVEKAGNDPAKLTACAQR